MVDETSGLRTTDFGLIPSGLAIAAKLQHANNTSFNIFLPFQACEIKR